MTQNSNLSLSPAVVFGSILYTLRLKKGFDQRAMAKNLEITQATWSRIENGHAVPNLDQIITSCVCLDFELVFVIKLYSEASLRLAKNGFIIDVKANEVDCNDTKNLVRKIISDLVN
ncbi:helix-turn-helix transcriptional regulator [Pantoea sp.]|uniref:helix-turn-helix domain-containing protein n=1 Tax=Pantoea sp. TaxID=69393 RepID=UPI0028B1145F|nr:helix-turn-helix transcriptional regulator [Pantoea sp.]